ncbi:hypothetical protein HK101_005940, partial [Irineochytrium annulatum]
VCKKVGAAPGVLGKLFAHPEVLVTAAVILGYMGNIWGQVDSYNIGAGCQPGRTATTLRDASLWMMAALPWLAVLCSVVLMASGQAVIGALLLMQSLLLEVHTTCKGPCSVDLWISGVSFNPSLIHADYLLYHLKYMLQSELAYYLMSILPEFIFVLPLLGGPEIVTGTYIYDEEAEEEKERAQPSPGGRPLSSTSSYMSPIGGKVGNGYRVMSPTPGQVAPHELLPPHERRPMMASDDADTAKAPATNDPSTAPNSTTSAPAAGAASPKKGPAATSDAPHSPKKKDAKAPAAETNGASTGNGTSDPGAGAGDADGDGIADRNRPSAGATAAVGEKGKAAEDDMMADGASDSSSNGGAAGRERHNRTTESKEKKENAMTALQSLGSGGVRRGKPKIVVDREKTCPFLVRVFCKFGSHHSLSEYDVGKQPTADEMQIHTWKDATLRELATLLAQIHPEAGAATTKVSFKAAYQLGGAYNFKDLGSVLNLRRGGDDDRTLDEV